MNSRFNFIITISLAAFLLTSLIPSSYGQSTGIKMVMDRGIVLEYHVNFGPPSILIDLKTFADAELIVKIPRSILDAKDGTNDIDFRILTDSDKLTNFTEDNSKYFRTLTIQVPVGSSMIKIIGTEILGLPASDETDLIRINTYPDISKIHSPHIRNNEWNVEIVMDGVYQDNGRIFVVVSGQFSTNFPSNEIMFETYIREGNRNAIVNVSHPSNSYLPGATYDLTVIHGEYSKTIQWIPLPRDAEVVVDIEDKTRFVKIINWEKGQLENRWIAWLEVCAGKNYLTSPILQVTSDLETRQKEVFKIIQPGSCISSSFTVFAEDPSSIQVSFLEKIKGSEMHAIQKQVLEEKIDELRKENSELKSEIAKKDAVLMEQLRTIENLANKIRNAVFEIIGF